MSSSASERRGRPIRILYVHSVADLYGASRSLLRLVTRLDRTRFLPTVLLPEDGPLAEALRAEGVPVLVLAPLGVMTRSIMRSWRALPFLMSLPISALRVASLARRLQIDIVHTNVAPLVALGAAARLAGVRHVWHLREFFHEFGPLWTLFRRYMVSSADKILCVSTPVAAQFLPGNGRIEVLHNGLPLDEFDAVSSDRVDRFRARFGLTGVRLVGVVGRIKGHRKGQDVFVRAVAELKRRQIARDVRFVIVGSPFQGNERQLENLVRQIASLGLSDDVVLTGEVEDIKAAMKSLHILVLPSAAPEPFGGVVLEAMALGVPVVGTRVGGTIEQVDDGVTGILVEPGSSVALADAIDRLLRDGEFHDAAGAAGRVRLEKRFAVGDMMTRLETLYQELAEA